MTLPLQKGEHLTLSSPRRISINTSSSTINSPLQSPSLGSRKSYDWGVNHSVIKIDAEKMGSDDTVLPFTLGSPPLGPPHAKPSLAQTIFGFPQTALSYILGSHSSPAPGYGHSKSKSISTKPQPKSNRHPALRLAVYLYLIFSTIVFSVHVLTSFIPSDSSLAPYTTNLTLSENTNKWAVKLAEGIKNAAGIVPLGKEDDTVIRRKDPGAQKTLNDFSLPYRLAKMHDKIHWDIHHEIIPNFIKSTAPVDPSDITACQYTNEAWLDSLPTSIEHWNGPMSVVVEVTHSKTSDERQALADRLFEMRNTYPLIKQFVDFHIVGTPTTVSERTLQRTRAKLISAPIAKAFHLNLARFFSHTDIIAFIPDPRVIPMSGVRERYARDRVYSKRVKSNKLEPNLIEEQTTSPVVTLSDVILENGDIIVIPTFAFSRDAETLAYLANSTGPALVQGVIDTVPPVSAWPTTKADIIANESLAVFDRRWGLNKGPADFGSWKNFDKSAALSTPSNPPLYKVRNYRVTYAPSMWLQSRRSQPWCDERFSDPFLASCTYEMYVSGSELFVDPEAFSVTSEPVELAAGTLNPATHRPYIEASRVGPNGLISQSDEDVLRSAVMKRLYGKFQAEVCLKNGRMILSVHMFNSDKADHLKTLCEKTLRTWGMGFPPSA